jgi:hypothetical protein
MSTTTAALDLAVPSNSTTATTITTTTISSSNNNTTTTKPLIDYLKEQQLLQEEEIDQAELQRQLLEKPDYWNQAVELAMIGTSPFVDKETQNNNNNNTEKSPKPISNTLPVGTTGNSLKSHATGNIIISQQQDTNNSPQQQQQQQQFGPKIQTNNLNDPNYDHSSSPTTRQQINHPTAHSCSTCCCSCFGHTHRHHHSNSINSQPPTSNPNNSNNEPKSSSFSLLSNNIFPSITTIFTIKNFFFLLRILISIGFLVGAILTQPTNELWAEIPATDWLTFLTITFASYDSCRLFVFLVKEFLRLSFNASLVDPVIPYYIHHLQHKIVFTGTTMILLISWCVIIADHRPANDPKWESAAFYTTRALALVFLFAALYLLSGFAKEMAGVYFHRVTFWPAVERTLTREYWLFWLLPNSVPHDICLRFYETTGDVVKNDPQFVNECTRYIRKTKWTGYSLSESDANLVDYSSPIEIRNELDAVDMADLVFLNIRARTSNTATAKEIALLNTPREWLTQARTRRRPNNKIPWVLSRGISQAPNSFKFKKSGSLRAFTPPVVDTHQQPESSPPATSTTSINSTSSKYLREANSAAAALIVTEGGTSTTTSSRISPPSANNTNNNIDFRITFETIKKAFPEADVSHLKTCWDTLLDPMATGECSRLKLRRLFVRFENERSGTSDTLTDAFVSIDRLGGVFFGVVVVSVIVFY